MLTHPRIYYVVVSVALINTATTFASTEPPRPPEFAARRAMKTDLIVHRAQQGHTRINGEINHVVTDRDKPMNHTLNETSRRLRTKKIGLQPKPHSPPVRRINTVLRTSTPLTIRTDPKRTRELQIGGVRTENHSQIGPVAFPPTRTLGGVVIGVASSVREVNVVVESPSIRVVASPKPIKPKRKRDRRNADGRHR